MEFLKAKEQIWINIMERETCLQELLEWNYFSPFIAKSNHPESNRSYNLSIDTWKEYNPNSLGM